MSDPFADRPFPRGALYAAAVLIGFTMVVVVSARLTGYDPAPMPAATVAESVDLRLESRPDGALAVYEASEDRLIDTLAPGKGGFVTGVLRGVDRERTLQDVDTTARLIRLTRSVDGKLVLDDLATGFHVDLVAFGPTNLAAFQRLFNEGSEAP